MCRSYLLVPDGSRTGLVLASGEKRDATSDVSLFFSPVALRPNAGHGLLILEVSRSHTTTHHSR